MSGKKVVDVDAQVDLHDSFFLAGSIRFFHTRSGAARHGIMPYGAARHVGFGVQAGKRGALPYVPCWLQSPLRYDAYRCPSVRLSQVVFETAERVYNYRAR